MAETKTSLSTKDGAEQGTEQDRFAHLKPWHFKPGQSGNPSGRPKGSMSMKEWVKKRLMEMDDDERYIFLTGLSKDIIWKMAEGNPQNDITSGGLPILQNEIIVKDFKQDASDNK